MAVERVVNITVKFLAPGLAAFTTELKGLNKEMAALRGETDKTRAQVSGLGKDVGKASKGVATYTKNVNKARTASDKLNNSSKKAKGGFANFGKQLVNTAAFLLRFAAVTAVFSAVSFAIFGTAKAAAEFEAALKDLQAVSGTSNENLEKLRENVFDVAGATTFTAQEIVALQKSLSRLGFTSNQVVNLTESVARFAEATGESAEEVATFVGKQLKAFNLATVDTTELVNAYTVAINNSALTLESLATSSQYVSSISSALGVTFKEQNALLATLTDNGLTASRAGTGLRKIFLELGAEGGSLIPVLDELGESGLSLSEAEELVGARAAGALLALVRQREAVSDLVDEQDDLNRVLIASARQNSTFKGQVRALKAAVDEIVISIGNWVSETEGVLELIELLSGKTEIRGFKVLDQLGLSGAEISAVKKNLGGLVDKNGLLLGTGSLVSERKSKNFFRFLLGQKEVYADINKIAEVFNVSQERAFVLAERLIKIREDDPENLSAFDNVLIDVIAKEEERLQIIKEANEEEKEFLGYSEQLEVLEEGSIERLNKRDELYESIGDRIVEVAKEEKKLRDKAELGVLGKDEERELSLVEKRLSLLYAEEAAIVGNTEAKDEGNQGHKETIKSYESLLKLEDAVAEAIMEGDEAKRRSLVADIEKRKNLLIELGLFEDYLEYAERIRKNRALAEQEEIIAEAAKGYVDSAKLISDALSERVALGEITPEDAKKQLQELINQYISAVENLNPKTKSDIQSALNEVFFGFDPKNPKEPSEKGLELFGLSEENTDFLINKAAGLANSVNGAILDATQRRLEAEQAAVDARYSFEEDRLNSLLQAGIISQEQYERQRLRLEKERVAKTNDIERKRFNAEKANSLAEIAIKTAISIAGTLDPVRIGIISAISAAQAAIVASQKFVPTKFKKGGMIEGASHEQGGVPFTVNGRAGFEAEGGEFIVNKKATEAFLPMLERINSFGSSSIPAQRQVFANGGVVPQGGGRTDDLLEQLVSQSSQRTIAYISEEQLISRNNTRITNDIRKRL